MAHHVLVLMAVALAAAALPGARGADLPANSTFDLAINTARVWLTTMEAVEAAVSEAVQEGAEPPAEIVWTTTRAHSMFADGYMVAASNGQVADIAAAITGFTESDLSTGYTEPLAQFPFGWAPSEVFYNVPELAGTPLRLDACAIAGILQGNITSWAAPELKELNPKAELPEEPITLVYLNLSMPITQCLTRYLESECPQGWPHGIVDNLGGVVVELPPLEVVASSDVEGNWRAVNSTPYSICIGASAPVGVYIPQYPDALAHAALRIADGRFVLPGGELDESAVADLASRAAADPDWSFLNERSPAVYPIAYWGLATLARNLTEEGEKGLFVRDTAGYLLTPQGQKLVDATSAYPLPDALVPFALKDWQSIEVAGLPGVKTGIPTPEASSNGLAAPAPEPAAPAPSSATTRTHQLIAVAALVAALLLA